MAKMSFTSRETANAAQIYNEMLNDKNCTIFLTLAGSSSAAGCMKVYADLVKNNMVDAIVSTGASIVDMDLFEALGFKHYQGSQFQNDNVLREHYIDRIYDTYIDEDQLQACDKTVGFEDLLIKQQDNCFCIPHLVHFDKQTLLVYLRFRKCHLSKSR